MKYKSIFKEEKIMPLDWDEGGAAITLTDFIFNHGIENIYDCNDQRLLSLYLERVQSEAFMVN